jgi:hypothetical protein
MVARVLPISKQTSYGVRGIPQAAGFTFIGFFHPFLVWKAGAVQEPAK